MKNLRAHLAILAGFVFALALMFFTEWYLGAIAGAMTYGGPSDDVQVVSDTYTGTLVISLPGSGHSLHLITATASGTITLPHASWAGQHLEMQVCQDGTGGWALGFGHVVGVTLHGAPLIFTTTASKCDIFAYVATDTSNWTYTGEQSNF